MRFFLALLAAKILRSIGAIWGRSTTLPGQVVLKIDPNFYKKIKVSGKVIAVTGSNGKTTTSAIVAHILRKQGYNVIHNSEGANVLYGVTTTLAQHSDFGGNINADFLVLETDERHTRLVYETLKLDIFLINNLVRDQVVRNGHPDIVFDKLSQAVQAGTTLVVNANDPISQRIAPNNPHVTFGMAQTPRSFTENTDLTHDCKICPNCFNEMHYEYYHYNHIGKFYCDVCGYKTPQPDYLADNVNYDSASFTINNLPAHVNLSTTYLFLNTTAAVAVAVTAGVALEDAVKAASSFEVSKERFEQFEVDDRTATLILTKQNSVSLDQSIAYTLAQKGSKTVVLYVNNVIYMENKDISWLYDVSFEKLLGEADYILAAGSRAYDVAVRLKHAGFSDEQIKIAHDGKDVRPLLKETQGPIYVLAASAFGNEDGIVEILKS